MLGVWFLPIVDACSTQHSFQSFDVDFWLSIVIQFRLSLYIILLYNVLVVVGNMCLLHGYNDCLHAFLRIFAMH